MAGHQFRQGLGQGREKPSGPGRQLLQGLPRFGLQPQLPQHLQQPAQVALVRIAGPLAPAQQQQT